MRKARRNAIGAGQKCALRALHLEHLRRTALESGGIMSSRCSPAKASGSGVMLWPEALHLIHSCPPSSQTCTR
jgi:hypothetical protein